MIPISMAWRVRSNAIKHLNPYKQKVPQRGLKLIIKFRVMPSV